MPHAESFMIPVLLARLKGSLPAAQQPQCWSPRPRLGAASLAFRIAATLQELVPGTVCADQFRPKNDGTVRIAWR